MSQLCDPWVLLSPPRLPGVAHPRRARLLSSEACVSHGAPPGGAPYLLCLPEPGTPGRIPSGGGLPAELGRGWGALRLELAGPPQSRRVLAKPYALSLSPDPVSLHRRDGGRGCPARHFPVLPPLGPRSPAPSLLRSATPAPPQSPGTSCEHPAESPGLWGHTC